MFELTSWKVCRYQKGPWIEKEQTVQRPGEKGRYAKQWLTKHHQVTPIPGALERNFK